MAENVFRNVAVRKGGRMSPTLVGTTHASVPVMAAGGGGGNPSSTPSAAQYTEDPRYDAEECLAIVHIRPVSQETAEPKRGGVVDVTPNAIEEDRGRTAAGDPGGVAVAGTVEGVEAASPGERGEGWLEVGADPAFFLIGLEDE